MEPGLIHHRLASSSLRERLILLPPPRQCLGCGCAALVQFYLVLRLRPRASCTFSASTLQHDPQPHVWFPLLFAWFDVVVSLGSSLVYDILGFKNQIFLLQDCFLLSSTRGKMFLNLRKQPAHLFLCLSCLSFNFLGEHTCFRQSFARKTIANKLQSHVECAQHPLARCYLVMHSVE